MCDVGARQVFSLSAQDRFDCMKNQVIFHPNGEYDFAFETDVNRRGSLTTLLKVITNMSQTCSHTLLSAKL